MTLEHFDEIMETLLDRRPFRPFAVELIGGRLIEIEVPGSVAIRDGFAIYLKPDGRFTDFDHEAVTQIIDHSPESNAGQDA